MAITQEYRDTWLDLIDKCIEQEIYGYPEYCALCPSDKDKIPGLPNTLTCFYDWGCICYTWRGMDCSDILKQKYPNLKNSGDRKWAPEYVRPVLKQAREWILAQKIVSQEKIDE
jgi:hypothetical protein